MPGLSAPRARSLSSDYVKNMSQDDQEFGRLQRLLVLKRYEQPPPGYFNGFSRQVIARIKAGEGARETVLQRGLWGATTLQRLWATLEAKPSMAAAFGAIVCGAFVAGAVLSERPEPPPGLLGPAMAAALPLELAHAKASPDQGPFGTCTSFPADLPLLSSPDQVIPEPAGTVHTISWPGAN